MELPVFWLAMLKTILPVHTGFSTQKLKKNLTRDVTFLQKSQGEYTKVDKPLVVNTSYEGLDKEEELKRVPVVVNNNNVNIVSDSDTNSSEEDFENNDDNFFDEDIDDQVKVTPKTAINSKVVQAMKMLQALYNDDANKIIK